MNWVGGRRARLRAKVERSRLHGPLLRQRHHGLPGDTLHAGTSATGDGQATSDPRVLLAAQRHPANARALTCAVSGVMQAEHTPLATPSSTLFQRTSLHEARVVYNRNAPSPGRREDNGRKTHTRPSRGTPPSLYRQAQAHGRRPSPPSSSAPRRLPPRGVENAAPFLMDSDEDDYDDEDGSTIFDARLSPTSTGPAGLSYAYFSSDADGSTRMPGRDKCRRDTSRAATHEADHSEDAAYLEVSPLQTSRRLSSSDRSSDGSRPGSTAPQRLQAEAADGKARDTQKSLNFDVDAWTSFLDSREAYHDNAVEGLSKGNASVKATQGSPALDVLACVASEEKIREACRASPAMSQGPTGVSKGTCPPPASCEQAVQTTLTLSGLAALEASAHAAQTAPTPSRNKGQKSPNTLYSEAAHLSLLASCAIAAEQVDGFHTVTKRRW